MSKHFLFYALLVLLLCTTGSVGFNWPEGADAKCPEKERRALLKFKQGIIDDYGKLSTWKDDENNTNCCMWRGIVCNNETGHVETLYLHDTFSLRGEMNLSLLIELQNLEHLDLSNTYDCYGQMSEQIGSFSNLRYLSLSRIRLVGKIPRQIGNLTHLRYLDLSSTSLVGAIPFQLGKLINLQYLDLSFNTLHGTIPHQIGNLTTLWHLHLESNSLSGAIPFQSGNLPMLQSLNLGYNDDLIISQKNHGDAEWLSSLSSLTNLDLTRLNLSSARPWMRAISKLLPNLRELGLGGCSLSDSDTLFLSDSPSNISTYLGVLSMPFNELTSAIFHWLFNFSTNIRDLDLTQNSMEGHIPSAFGNLMNYLENLGLSNNNLQGEIPTSFGNMCTLQRLYISSNNLSGEVSSLTQNSSRCNRHNLRVLDLSYNRITGKLPDLSKFSSLKVLYLQHNHLIGEMPKSMGCKFFGG